MKITKETLIGAVLDYDVDTAQFFFNMGMYCLGCPHSRGESIEQACMAHGTDADKLIADINAFLEKKAANN
jgi:hybrid cluster-associated redox disulfide protein